MMMSKMRRWLDAFPTAMASTSHFEGPFSRRTLLKKGFQPEQIVPYAYRPFDTRWLYWESETKLLDRARARVRAAHLGREYLVQRCPEQP